MSYRYSSPLRIPQSQGYSRTQAVSYSQQKTTSYNYRPYSSKLSYSPLRSSQGATFEKKQSHAAEQLGVSADKSTAYGSPSPTKTLVQTEELQPRKLDMDELASPEAAHTSEHISENQEDPKQEEAEDQEPEAKEEQPEVEEEESKAEAAPEVSVPTAEAAPEQRSRYTPPALTANEEFDLFWSLKRMIELESESERAKVDLALRYDFNNFDAFRVMDKYGKGEIFRFELSDALRNVGVYADRAEIELLYKKNDKNKDGKLTFSEFADSIAPLDRMANDALNRRQSNYRDPRPFSSMTMGIFEDTLRKILRTFGAVNDMNRRLREKPAFFISGAFERIDKNGNGFITREELQRFFDDHRHFATSKELDLLIARFDNDRDGRISYGEFFDGFSAV